MTTSGNPNKRIPNHKTTLDVCDAHLDIFTRDIPNANPTIDHIYTTHTALCHRCLIVNHENVYASYHITINGDPW